MILITGATGKVGGDLAKLLAQHRLPARALVRDAKHGAALRDLGIEFVIGDFDRPDTLRAALEGAERVFFLPPNGPAQIVQGETFIAAAKSAGVRQMVKVSGFLPEAESRNANARRHWKTNESLKRSGLSWTILRPSFYMQNLFMFIEAIREHAQFGLNAGTAICGMIHVRDIAAVAAVCLSTDGHEGREYALTGADTMSFADCAAALSRAAEYPITYVALDDAKFREQLFSQGTPDDMADGLTETYKGVGEGRFSLVTDTVARVAGRAPTSFADFAQEFATMLHA